MESAGDIELLKHSNATKFYELCMDAYVSINWTKFKHFVEVRNVTQYGLTEKKTCF